MTAIAIRRARAGDGEGIASVQRTSWNETYRGILPDSVIDEAMAPGRPEARWVERLESEVPNPVHSFVAVETLTDGGARVVGFAGAGPAREEVPGVPGEVMALYLLASRHGRGIGRELWQACLDDLAGRDLLPGYVWVLADNPTRGFYEHMGGVEIVRRKSRFEAAPHLEEVALRFGG